MCIRDSFHPALEDEPIIFVQVALTKGLGKSIQELMKPSNDEKKNYDTATFYSISNCQEGLSRVTLGNFLIKRVVYEIQEELPNIKNFGTLSPIPGFADWLSYVEEPKIKNILANLKNQDVSFLKSMDLKLGDSRIVKNKEAIQQDGGNRMKKQNQQIKCWRAPNVVEMRAPGLADNDAVPRTTGRTVKGVNSREY